VFILISFGFLSEVVIVEIGGVGRQRGIGCIGGVEMSPIFCSCSVSSFTSFSVDRKSFCSSLSGQLGELMLSMEGGVGFFSYHSVECSRVLFGFC